MVLDDISDMLYTQFSNMVGVSALGAILHSYCTTWLKHTVNSVKS